MKLKVFLSLVLAGSLMAAAQTQGYKDGIEYYKAGQYENARTILNRTINDANTDQSLANYYLGQVCLAKGQKAEAEKYFKKGLDLNPDNGYNYAGMGALDLLNGKVDAAEDNFKTAVKKDKKNAELLVAIARAYYNADRVKNAVQVEEYIKKARKVSKSKAPSIFVFEGDMAYNDQDYGKAAAKYENAIFNDPTNSEGYVKYANAYFFVNKDYAIQKLEELLQSQPNSAMAQRELAEKYFKADHWKKASDLYGKYIQNPNHFPEDKARYGVLLYWGERYPEALNVAQEILAQNPNDFQSQRIQILSQSALQQYPEAIANAQKFFASHAAGDFTTNDYLTYAGALEAVGQDSLALVQYETAVKRAPENGDLLKTLSSAYSKNKMFGKSADAYGAYVKLQENPSLEDLFGMSGRYLNAAANAKDSVEARKYSQEGVAYVKQVIEKAEVTPVMYQRLGHLYVAANNKRPNADAIAAYDQMIALIEKDPENLNPANPANLLDMYWQGYAFKQAYASMNGDKANQIKFGEKIKAIDELRKQRK